MHAALSERASEAVEDALAQERRNMLLAMPTGTGKTKLAIAMLRLLAAKRFRRIAFIGRNALGTQAACEFSTTRIVSAKTFPDIFGLKGLDTITPDPETKVHICTIQGLPVTTHHRRGLCHGSRSEVGHYGVEGPVRPRALANLRSTMLLSPSDRQARTIRRVLR